MQYTLRNIPAALDAALRRKAREENRSLNEVLLEALAHALGFGAEQRLPHRDLKDLAGTWKSDKAFDEAVADQHRIDKDLWK